MQKTRNILLIGMLALLVFAAGVSAQTTDKVFIKTPDGKLVHLTVNGEKAMLGVKLLPTAVKLKITGIPMVDQPNQLTYTYRDDLGRTQNSAVLSWYLADDKAGKNKTKVASGANYTPGVAAVGKYMRAGVLTIANNGSGGTISGEEVFTPWLKVRSTFYQNAYEGLGTLHMTFLVVNVDFGASGHLVAGDEIAVFDGSICCGRETVTGPIVIGNEASFVTLAASKVSEGADGFTPGHAISIRVYSKATSATTDYAATLQFLDMNGDPVTAPVFTENETVVVKLTVSP